MVARTCVGILGRTVLWQLVYADDVNWLAKGVSGIRGIVLALFVMTALGTPFSWRKIKGGFAYPWIGLEVNLEQHALGLSAARAEWLQRWIDGVLERNGVLMGELASVLGRLSFAAGPLERIRPFLSSLFAWVAVTPSDAYLAPNPEVRLCLKWIAAKLSRGGRLEPCRHLRREHHGVLFRADARAADDGVVVGGWECKGGKPPGEARWFSVALNADNAPWLLCKGESFRVIAALELLASLISVVVFMPPGLPDDGAYGLSCSAETDNKGNSYAVRKMMSTAFPLNAMLMELSEQLEARQSWLDLAWVPRQQNLEADALTNGDFDAFSPSLRIEVDLKSLPWVVLPEMLEAGAGMVAELDELRKGKRKARAEARARKRERKRLGGSHQHIEPW